LKPQPPPRKEPPREKVPPYSSLLFNLILFFTGVGGVFFRMARDNDDLVRAALVLSMAAGCTFLLAAKKTRVPSSLAVPCLAFAFAQFTASINTLNPAESLKEFIKIGFYMMIFLTLASAGADKRECGETEPPRRTLAFVLGLFGVIIGLVHAAPSLPSFSSFPLWSNRQVIASLFSAVLLCAAFAFILARGTLRNSVLAGGAVMATLACVLGILQFYAIDPLRPWDPRQPYMTPIRHLPAEVLNFLAAITAGRLQMDEGGGLVLTVPRILGIYGNPDFFAPYLMQFIPFAVAVTWLDPARRTRGALLVLALATVLGLTAVWGAFLSLVLLAPFFAVLLYYVAGKTTREQAVRTSLILLAVGTVLAAAGTMVLFKTAAKHSSIEERVVKWRMAEAMWERNPLTGVGLNAYKTWYPLLQQGVRLQHEWQFELLGSSFTQENRTHNDIAQMIGETGVLGFGTFAWFMTVLISVGLRRLLRWQELAPADRASVCGLLGGILVTLIYALPNFPFHIVSSAGTFWIMAGLLASYHRPAVPGVSPEAPDFAPAPSSVRLAPQLKWAACATVLVTTIFAFSVFWGTLHYKRGDTFSRLAKPPDPVKAAAEYQIALDLDGSNAQYAYDYGAMCFNSLNTDKDLGAKAEPMLKQALRWGFVNEDLAYGLAHLAELKKDNAEAYKWYSFATTLNERHEPSRQGRLRMLLLRLGAAEDAARKKEWKKARSLYEESIKKDPENFLAAYKMGTLLITVYRNLPDGIRYLEAAAAGGVNEPTMYATLGRAYASASRWEDSLGAFIRVQTLNPRDQETASAISQLQEIIRRMPPAPPPGPAAGTPERSAPAGK